MKDIEQTESFEELDNLAEGLRGLGNLSDEDRQNHPARKKWKAAVDKLPKEKKKQIRKDKKISDLKHKKFMFETGQILRTSDVAINLSAYNGMYLRVDTSQAAGKNFVFESVDSNTGYANTAGISTYAITAGIATDATNAGYAKTAGISTIWIPAIAMVSPTTIGAELNAIETTAVKPEIKVLDFDPSTIEYAQFSIAMPKSWDESTVTAKFY